MKKKLLLMIMATMMMTGCAPKYVNEGGLVDWYTFNEHTNTEEHIVFADGYDSFGRYSAFSDGSMKANSYMSFAKKRKERLGLMQKGVSE